jgi:Ca2+-binding EF-hand superfamily protein
MLQHHNLDGNYHCNLLSLYFYRWFRCINTNLRVQLSSDEEDLLFQKYDLKHDGTICYREFCDVINRSKSF